MKQDLIEWGDFWPQYFRVRPFTRRVAKRLIDTKDLPGKVIGDKPYIDRLAFEVCKPPTPSARQIDDDLLDMI